VLPLGLAACVHPTETEVAVMAELVKALGLVHVGIGAQVTLDNQPAKATVGSEVNTNVKHPLAAVEVNGPGKLAPVNVPEYVPKSVPAGLFPLYTLKISNPAS
jgi:hypothetical protein